MALATDVRAHFLARGHGIDVVVRDALRCLERPYAFHECRAGDAQLHRAGVVTVDASDRVLHSLANLGISHVRVADGVEALHQIAIPQLQISGNDRGVAIDAHRRRRELLPFREGLVIEHVGMAAALAVIGGEGVSRPDGFQPRILLEFRSRHHRAGIGLRRGVRHPLAPAVLGALHVHRAQVEIVLHGEVLSPDGGIVDGVVQFDHAIERIARFLLAFEDVDQERGDRDCGESGQCDHQRQHAARRCGAGIGSFSHGCFLQQQVWESRRPCQSDRPRRGSVCTRCLALCRAPRFHRLRQ